REAKFPALEVVRSAGKGVVIAILAMAANSVFFYMATVFALSYGERQGASRGLILIAVMCAAAAQIITLPIAAVLADRYGRRPVMIAGCLIGAASAFPIFWLLDTTNFLAILAAMVLAIPVVHSLTYAPMASFISELFETRLRYSGSAMGYQ
ncbi:MFS transporter, partial [Roseateles chitinivorans]